LPLPAPPPADRASFTVVPAELGDPGVLDRIHHRARVRRIGNIWLRVDGQISRNSTEHTESDYVLPVIGESHAKIRVVADDDDARLAVWISRTDAWDSITTPIQLADREGHAAPNAGVWVGLGAPVEATPHGERRSIRVRDDAVRALGWVPASVVAKVWTVPAGDRSPTDMKMNESHSFVPPADKRDQLALAIHTVIRAAADANAPAIATIEQIDVRGALLATIGAFREIELVRPHMRIRGFVSASDATPALDLLIGHGSGTGSGFGMSHADRIDLVAGTCLFDAADGEVVGVQLAPSTRLGRHSPDGAWSSVYVHNSWSLATLYVRDTSDDPKQPRWESCAEPAHRR